MCPKRGVHISDVILSEIILQMFMEGEQFNHHFTFGRSVVTEVANDSIQTRNQTLMIPALELLLRGMNSDNQTSLDFLDAQDLLSMVRHIRTYPYEILD